MLLLCSCLIVLAAKDCSCKVFCADPAAAYQVERSTAASMLRRRQTVACCGCLQVRHAAQPWLCCLKKVNSASKVLFNLYRIRQQRRCVNGSTGAYKPSCVGGCAPRKLQQQTNRQQPLLYGIYVAHLRILQASLVAFNPCRRAAQGKQRCTKRAYTS
jgi:hypothetical protein